MATAGFNDQFWVAVAAAAPVIGLSSVVAADQAVKALERARDRARQGTQGQQPPKSPGPAFWVTYFNILVQAGALAAALRSLSGRTNTMPMALAIFIEFFGMVLIFVPTRATGKPGPG
jgi:hypothetical protein